MPIHDCDAGQDLLLLSQLTAGDKASFGLLYEKYWETVYAEGYKRLKDRDQAKDIVQDIFTSLWLRRETLRIENLPAYLKTAVRNRVFKILAKEKITHPFFDFLHEIPSGAGGPDGNLLWQEFLRSYENFVGSLPPRKQLIFRLRFQEDLSTQEIAQRMGLSRKTVQNQIGRVIEHLKLHLFYTIKIILLLASFYHDDLF